MGQLMSAFALGYLLFQIPGGWFGNRFGTRLAFALLSTLWSLCNVATAAASALPALLISRFSLGAFQAGLVPISAKIVSDWTPLRSRGRSSSMISASMSVGGAFAMWLTGQLLSNGYAWRTIFAAYSMVGICWSIVFYWYFRTSPKEHRQVNAAELNLILEPVAPTPVAQAGTPIRRVLHSTDSDSGRFLFRNMVTSFSMWGICVQAFFQAAGYVFFVTWFFAFLEYAYGITKAEAGMLNSLPLMAVVAGSLSGGMIIDGLLKLTGNRWLSRTGTAIFALTVCSSLTMASAWTSSATQLSIVIAFGAYFSGIANPCMWSATIDIGGRQTALVMGVMNMAGCLAMIILPTLLGNWFNQIRTAGGNWNLVIYLHAGFYFIAALSWLAVNPNRNVGSRIS